MNIPQNNQENKLPNELPVPQMPLNRPDLQAAEGLGNTIEDVGLKALHEANVSRVQQASVEFMTASNKIQTEALNKKGQDAFDYNDSVKYHQELYNQIKGQLHGDQVRMFAEAHGADNAKLSMNLLNHANDQHEKLNDANAAAYVDAKLSQAILNGTNGGEILNQDRIDYFDGVKYAMKRKGIPEDSDEGKAVMLAASTQLEASLVKAMFIDRPSEALKYLKEHHTDKDGKLLIDDKTYDALLKETRSISEAKLGVDTAHDIYMDPANKDLSPTKLHELLYQKLKDNPSAFAHGKQEMQQHLAQVKADQTEEATGHLGVIEGNASKVLASGGLISEKWLMQQKDFQELLKKVTSGDKQAAIAVANARTFVVSSNNAARINQHIADQQFEAKWLQEDAQGHSLSEIKEDGLNAGASASVIERVTKRTVKEGKDGNSRVYRTANSDFIGGVVEAAGIKPGTKEYKHLITAAQNSILNMEKTQDRNLSDDEMKEAVIKGLRKTKVPGFMGFGEKEIPELEMTPAQRKAKYPWEGNKQFNAAVQATEKIQSNRLKKPYKIPEDQYPALWKQYINNPGSVKKPDRLSQAGDIVAGGINKILDSTSSEAHAEDLDVNTQRMYNQYKNMSAALNIDKLMTVEEWAKKGMPHTDEDIKKALGIK